MIGFVDRLSSKYREREVVFLFSLPFYLLNGASCIHLVYLGASFFKHF